MFEENIAGNIASNPKYLGNKLFSQNYEEFIHYSVCVMPEGFYPEPIKHQKVDKIYFAVLCTFYSKGFRLICH